MMMIGEEEKNEGNPYEMMLNGNNFNDWNICDMKEKFSTSEMLAKCFFP